MSAGTFTIRIYEADSAFKHLIKQNVESAIFSMDGTANAIPAGPATSPFWAETNRGATQYGLRPRKLRFRFNPGEAPTGYIDCGTYEIVVYSKGVFDGVNIGAPATYLGGAGQIIGRVAESIYPVV